MVEYWEWIVIVIAGLTVGAGALAYVLSFEFFKFFATKRWLRSLVPGHRAVVVFGLPDYYRMKGPDAKQNVRVSR
jgi:hypothetical protein